MTTIYVLDVDGTIANNEHRARLLYHECHQCLTGMDGLTGPGQFVCPHCGCMDSKATSASWDRFNDLSLMEQDTPIPRTQKCVKALESLGYPVHYLTARYLSQREVTLGWLQVHFGFDASKQYLLTRDTDDHHGPKSHEFKENAVKQLRALCDSQYENPNYVFVDDKSSNLKMFSRHGLSLKAPEFWQTMR